MKKQSRNEWPKELSKKFPIVVSGAGKRSAPSKLDKIHSGYNFKKLSPRQVFAFESLMAACGVAAAQRYIAQCYDYGWSGQDKDPLLAEVWYSIAAQNGDLTAAYNLAEIYSDRKEGDPRAISLLETCVSRGHIEAAVGLGRIYFHGIGVKRNVAKGLSLYKRAAAKKSPRAIYNLGFCYAYGDEVKKDLKRAKNYYKQLLKLDRGLARKLAKYLK